MPQREMCACFTGHRELPRGEIPALRRALDETLESAWRRGYRSFYNGGALGFDMLAAEGVLHLQQRHPDVKLEIDIPHAHQTDGWPTQERLRYERLVYLADVKHILSPLYYQGCYHVRNRFMVDRASLCICEFVHSKGGTASTVAYAVQEGLTVVNLALPSSWQSYVKENGVV